MKPIATPAEPPCLAAWRAEHPTASWQDFKTATRDTPEGARGCARAVWETLIESQHGLCAFCEIELAQPYALWSQVEHWHPKDPARYPGHNWGLDFANMMAGCEGGERDKPATERSLPPIKETQHCGPAKGNEDYTSVLLDPRRDVPLAVPLWTFDANGNMRVHPAAPPALITRAEETMRLLNLHSTVLKRLRSQLWTELENDVQQVWEELGGAEEDFLRAYDCVAAEHLALAGNRLHRFWSTIRSYLGASAETWIAAHPEVYA
ncbi:MAG TPA: TIGR02646 family protein [Myxococcota bacterium]|nr:TIGR02646 family protein [Myxococcota bacterium]